MTLMRPVTLYDWKTQSLKDTEKTWSEVLLDKFLKYAKTLKQEFRDFFYFLVLQIEFLSKKRNGQEIRRDSEDWLSKDCEIGNNSTGKRLLGKPRMR